MSKNHNEQPAYSREYYEQKQDELAAFDEEADQRATEIHAQYEERLNVYKELREEDAGGALNDPELIEEEKTLIREREEKREEILRPINKNIAHAKAELTNLYVKAWNEASREEARREHIKALTEVKKIHQHITETSQLIETSYGRLQSMIREASCIAVELEEMLSDPRYTSDEDEDHIKELAQSLVEIEQLIEEEAYRLRGHRRGESKDDLN